MFDPGALAFWTSEVLLFMFGNREGERKGVVAFFTPKIVKRHGVPP